MGLEFCFYCDQGWGPRVLWAHSLLGNVKYKSRDLKYRKRKIQVAQMVSYQNQLRFLNQEMQ